MNQHFECGVIAGSVLSWLDELSRHSPVRLGWCFGITRTSVSVEFNNGGIAGGV